MQRRYFLAGLFLGATSSLLANNGNAVTGCKDKSFLIQESSIAGFQHHQGEQVWDQLAVGQEIKLVREPANPYDKQAVAIYWQDAKLGYLPRQTNYTIAQMVDRWQRLHATLIQRREHDNTWKRLRICIEMDGYA